MPAKKGKRVIRDRAYNPERARKLREANKRTMELLRKSKQQHKKRNKK
jgi:hypothetical protein